MEILKSGSFYCITILKSSPFYCVEILKSVPYYCVKIPKSGPFLFAYRRNFENGTFNSVKLLKSAPF